MTALTAAQRGAVLDRVLRAIETKFMGPDVDTASLREKHRTAVLNAGSSDAFEATINDLLRDLGVSHTGFFHESAPRAGGRIALAATFTKADTPDGQRWVFQDVHPGGVAAAAGIRPGDVLLSVAGKELTPPQATPFTLGERYELVLRKPDGSTVRPTLSVPKPRDKKQPLVVPEQVVTAARLNGGIGLIRVSMFPGVLGMDVARDMSRAVRDLDCDRLIIDLRGNTGGGIGCLRLMSLMCADRRGVGYSLGRAALNSGRSKASPLWSGTRRLVDWLRRVRSRSDLATALLCPLLRTTHGRAPIWKAGASSPMFRSRSRHKRSGVVKTTSLPRRAISSCSERA